MLQIKDLEKRFKKKAVLSNINLSLSKGVYGILGPNGSGKTTLFRCMTGLFDDFSGKIELDGKTVDFTELNKHIGYLPQCFSVFPEMTVYEVLEFFAELKKIKKANIKQEIDTCIECAGLQEYKNLRGKELSGGMIRRVGIAQALLGNPRILILDEPNVGLDPEEQIRLKNLITSISQERTIIMSSHIVSDIETVCDNLIILKEGKVICTGTVAQIISLAANKVYEIQDYNESDLKAALVVEKEFIKKDKKTVRIITENKCRGEVQDVTLEDAYLYLMNKL